MKKVAILQSNYIPWKGYFDLISYVDEFIIYDDMQYTKNDWRNRNKIKTPHGLIWLTVPVYIKGKLYQKIRDTKINGSSWISKHLKTLRQYYGKASFYTEIQEWLEPLYSDKEWTHLSELNRAFIDAICNYLDIGTKISNSWDYTLIDGKTERLVDLCYQAKATEYVSGPAAKGYLEEQLFQDAGIRLTWFDYDGYPLYTQLKGEFCHNVSVLDLLFNCGKSSKKYMRYVH